MRMKIKDLKDIEKESFKVLLDLIHESGMKFDNKFKSLSFHDFKIEFKNYSNEQLDLFTEIQITDAFGFKFKYVYTKKSNAEYSRISLVIYDFNDINDELLHQRAINIAQAIKEKYNREKNVKQYLNKIYCLCLNKYKTVKEPVIIKEWKHECPGSYSGPYYIEGQTTYYREVEYCEIISLFDIFSLEYIKKEVQKMTYGFDLDFVKAKDYKNIEKIIIKGANDFVLAEWNNFLDINGFVIKKGYEDIVENTLLNTYIKILLNNAINRIVKVNSYVENDDIDVSDIWYRFVKSGNSFEIIAPNDKSLVYDEKSNLLSVFDNKSGEMISPICYAMVEYLNSDENMYVEISPNEFHCDIDKGSTVLYLEEINDNLNQESKFLSELIQLNSKIRECRNAKSRIKLPETV